MQSTAAKEPRVLAGKYRLEAQLRSGAMGAIYRAHHLTLDKTVCIKIMHPELARDVQFAMRFHREARAASRFDHPNSILVLDYGADEDGTLFMAMELVDGRDLFDIIEEATGAPGGIGTAFPPRRIVDLLSQTLAALAAAHDVGILHRDLKPENIMVTSSRDDGERVRVCDFGIAHMEDRDFGPESGRRLTRRGFILGTPEYMSPEQARADGVDARSDVYSAGMILYQLLTGRLPFEDESPLAVALMQINVTPPKPSELNPNVHRALEAVCLKAISKDPADRYKTAREMRAALRDAVAMPHATPLPLAIPVATLPEPTPPPALERLSSLPAVQVEAVMKPRSMRPFLAVAACLVAASVGATWKLRPPPVSVIATASAATASTTTTPSATASSSPETAPLPSSSMSLAEEVVTKPSPIAATMPPRKVATTRAAPKPDEHPPAAVTSATSAPELAPAPSPTMIPEPSPVPPPLAARPSAPPPAPAPSYSLETAHVDLGAAETVGATSASVDRALAPVKSRLDACYRAALPKASTHEGTATLHIETDDVGNIRQATVTGALAAELGACVAKAVVGRKIANVDTGHASAEVPLLYRPR